MSQPLPNKNLPMPSLRNIQAFIEVAATGSLNLAAENLNITASAVSHQIASLEHFLGKKLFSRSSKGVMLTAVGEKYLKEVSGALNMIGQATSQVINDIHQDYLRIHSAPSFGLLWLMPRLDKFRQAWPELKISLTCSYESIQSPGIILISIFVTGYHSGQRCWSEPLKMSASCPTAQRLI